MSTSNLDEQTERLAEQFFSYPPVSDRGVEAWEPAPLSTETRIAMRVTFGLLGCCVLSLLGYPLLSEIVLVQPAELAGSSVVMPLPVWSASEISAHHAATSTASTASTVSVVSSTTNALSAAASAVPAVRPELPIAAVAAQATVMPTAAPRRAAVRAKAQAQIASSSATQEIVSNDATQAARLNKEAYRELRGGRHARAESLARAALELDNTRASSYIVLGGARDAMGDREGSRRAFRLCVEHARDSLASACKALSR